mmetsp:Transcript_22829/g.70782  ORF Transcript_22829/g.70782 Transcript_22829/m.70782 type:complete len:211 (-) Transcript_22829:1474-2106(-)
MRATLSMAPMMACESATAPSSAIKRAARRRTSTRDVIIGSPLVNVSRCFSAKSKRLRPIHTTPSINSIALRACLDSCSSTASIHMSSSSSSRNSDSIFLVKTGSMRASSVSFSSSSSSSTAIPAASTAGFSSTTTSLYEPLVIMRANLARMWLSRISGSSMNGKGLPCTPALSSVSHVSGNAVAMLASTATLPLALAASQAVYRSANVGG